MEFKKLDSTAIIPIKAYSGDAGYDLYALKDTTIYSNKVTPVETGIACQIPEGYYGRIAARSGLGIRVGFCVTGGVIDSNYTGELKILSYLANDDKYDIKAKDKFAQLIIEKIFTGDSKEVKHFSRKTDRGDCGFGSTGK